MALDCDGQSVVGVSGCGLHGGQDSTRFDFGGLISGFGWGPFRGFNGISMTFAVFFSNLCHFCMVFELGIPSFTSFPLVRWLSLSLPSFPSSSSPVSPQFTGSRLSSHPHSFAHPCFTFLPKSTFTLVNLKNSTRHTSRTCSFSHQHCRRQFLNHPSHGCIYYYLVTLFLMFHHHHLDSRHLSLPSCSCSIPSCFSGTWFSRLYWAPHPSHHIDIFLLFINLSCHATSNHHIIIAFSLLLYSLAFLAIFRFTGNWVLAEGVCWDVSCDSSSTQIFYFYHSSSFSIVAFIFFASFIYHGHSRAKAPFPFSFIRPCLIVWYLSLSFSHWGTVFSPFHFVRRLTYPP